MEEWKKKKGAIQTDREHLGNLKTAEESKECQ